MEEAVRNRAVWTQGGIEPSIDELLSDPIAVAVMRADGLRLEEVWEVIRVRRRRHQSGPYHAGLTNAASLAQFSQMLARIGLGTADAPLARSTRDDLYATCAACLNREPCRRWLASDQTAEGYQAFCPNASMFDRLLRVSQWRRA